MLKVSQNSNMVLLGRKTAFTLRNYDEKANVGSVTRT